MQLILNAQGCYLHLNTQAVRRQFVLIQSRTCMHIRRIPKGVLTIVEPWERLNAGEIEGAVVGEERSREGY